MKHYNIIRWC